MYYYEEKHGDDDDDVLVLPCLLAKPPNKKCKNGNPCCSSNKEEVSVCVGGCGESQHTRPYIRTAHPTKTPSTTAVLEKESGGTLNQRQAVGGGCINIQQGGFVIVSYVMVN